MRDRGTRGPTPPSGLRREKSTRAIHSPSLDLGVVVNRGPGNGVRPLGRFNLPSPSPQSRRTVVERRRAHGRARANEQRRPCLAPGAPKFVCASFHLAQPIPSLTCIFHPLPIGLSWKRVARGAGEVFFSTPARLSPPYCVRELSWFHCRLAESWVTGVKVRGTNLWEHRVPCLGYRARGGTWGGSHRAQKHMGK